LNGQSLISIISLKMFDFNHTTIIRGVVIYQQCKTFNTTFANKFLAPAQVAL